MHQANNTRAFLPSTWDHATISGILALSIITAILMASAAPGAQGCSFCPVVVCDLSTDRTRPFRTKLPVNQPYLNKIASPTDAAVLVQTFTELAQAQAQLPRQRPAPLDFTCLLHDQDPRRVVTCSERLLRVRAGGEREVGAAGKGTLDGFGPTRARPLLPRGRPLLARPLRSEALTEDTEALVARWRRAEEGAVFADDANSARFFLRLARDYPDQYFGHLALLEAAQWQHRVGCDDGPQGAEALLRALADQSPLLRHAAQFGLAELALSRGRYDEARQGYGALARECREAQVLDWCAFRLAQCDEFTGQFAEAANTYAACAKSSDKALAGEAGYAAKRVRMLEESSQPSPTHATVRYLGEDRATQGDWYLRYGREAFILCAQQAPQDVAGGCGFGTNPPTRWEVIPAVGNPKETTRYWVTSRSTEHRSLLYNPLSKVRRAANWDDRGEAYPLGTGPDLLLEVPVPEGEHVVSLYFVNDRNYYEPERVYTISVFDEAGRYQTGAEARNFVRGTYYRFAASGPQKLRFRLWRNLAINLIFAGIFLDKPGTPSPWPERVTLWAPHSTTVALPGEARAHDPTTP